MIRAIIKPSRSMFGGRRQWKFEIRATNGERIDPRETYANREDLIETLETLFGGQIVELVIMDRHGNVEDRRQLR
jgi:hypothetical protein